MNHKLKDNLKKIRKEYNLSQEQLAEELGVSRQAISKWESGVAYPEMDKILTLCNKFHLNIDDLLNKDIGEVKGEEETKNNLNKYLDDFMKYITDTINLLISMKWKSKIKCILEQAVIIFILLFIFSAVFLVIGSAVSGFLYSLLPYRIYSILQNFLETIYILIAITLGTIILLKVFKIRYLNYYEEWLEKKEEKKEQEVKQDTKIEYKKEDKIIIRDPKHGEYRFINAFYKVMIIGIKFCALWLNLFLLVALFFTAFFFIFSFSIWKSGLFFIGVVLALFSTGILLIVPIYFIFNFIFNRKSNKKVMIWSFLLGVVLLGISCGITSIGFLDFEEIEASKDTYSEEINMTENMFFSEHTEYIEEARQNIRIEYSTCKNCTVEIVNRSYGLVDFICTEDNTLETIKEVLKEFNNKKIIVDRYYYGNVKVYASKENIQKLKQNEKVFYDTIDSYEKRLDEQEEEIRQRDQKIEEQEDKIEEQEEIIENYGLQLSEYEERLSEND